MSSLTRRTPDTPIPTPFLKLQSEGSDSWMRSCPMTLESNGVFPRRCKEKIATSKFVFPLQHTANHLRLTSGTELHRLVVEDFAQLKRRADEITEAIINITCSYDKGQVREVRQAPIHSSFPGHASVSCLSGPSLGLSAVALE